MRAHSITEPIIYEGRNIVGKYLSESGERVI